MVYMKSDETGFVLSQGAELRLQKFRQNYGFELHTKKTMPTCHFEDNREQFEDPTNMAVLLMLI